MCIRIGRKLSKEVYTGYKAVVKVSNRYYSPATGVEYIPGQKVQGTYKFLENTKKFWSENDILNPKKYSFIKNYFGKTAVYCFERDVKCFAVSHSLEYPKDKLIIVKITLSTNLRRGKLGLDGVIVGEKIVKIEEVIN